LSDFTTFTPSWSETPGAIDAGALNSSRTFDGEVGVVGVGVGVSGDAGVAFRESHDAAAIAMRTVAAIAAYRGVMRMVFSSRQNSTRAAVAEF
jgi:hypothetical protein